MTNEDVINILKCIKTTMANPQEYQEAYIDGMIAALYIPQHDNTHINVGSLGVSNIRSSQLEY